MRMLAMRSVCSCTYGLTGFPVRSNVHALAPVRRPGESEDMLACPFAPRKCSSTLPAVPLICRHMLMTRAPLGYSKSIAK